MGYPKSRVPGAVVPIIQDRRGAAGQSVLSLSKQAFVIQESILLSRFKGKI